MLIQKAAKSGAKKTCNRTHFRVFWANQSISNICHQKASIFGKFSYFWPNSGQRMFVIQLSFVFGYKFGTNLKYRVKIPIFFWGRGHLFKRFPLTRDTLCIGFALPKEIRFFLLANFVILIGNLSSKVIWTINFHMVFRGKLTVVSLMLLRPELEFIHVKSFSSNF